MCGIVGFVGAGDRALLEAMNGAIAHRGPDDAGFFLDRAVGLAMRRLAIIDLAGGRQPMASDDGAHVIVFNGEIYNFRALRERYLADAPFRTHSDTEVVLRLYQALGNEAFALLNGMFAVAILETATGRVTLARDRLGIKPLYYHVGPTRVSFASELKGLLQDPAIARQIAPDSLERFVTWQYVPGPDTLLQGVKKLPPGHLMVLAPDRAPLLSAYWRAEAGAASAHPSDFAAMLRAAVRRQMVADVPVGAFLSGGLDSSLVVAMMAEQAGDRLETFTAGFDDPRLDESPWAAEVAKLLGVRHHVVRLDDAALEELPTLARHLDDPIADRAALPTLLLSRFARERVKVVLTGEGSDELFAGYPRYRLELLAQGFHRLPLSERRGLWRAIVGLVPGRMRAPLAKLLLSPADPGARREQWVANFPADARARLLVAPMRDQAIAPDSPGLQAQLLLDLRTWLVDNVLMKVDKITMAASLEARVPFLDFELVDWALALPEAARLHGKTTKWVVKQAAERLLPRRIVHRQKQGFHTPTAMWFRQARGQTLLRDVLLSPEAERGYFRRAEVERLITAHAAGADHDQALWNLLILELWLRAFVDRRPEVAPVSLGSAP